jgi:hypothetical protein
VLGLFIDLYSFGSMAKSGIAAVLGRAIYGLFVCLLFDEPPQ